MLKKFKYGFSLTEIIVAIVILIGIIALALIFIIQKTKMNEEKIERMSKTYYGKIENVYNQIVSYNTINGTISEISDINKDTKQDNNDLRDFFNQYMDGKNIECTKFGIIPKNLPASRDMVCSTHKGDIITGYYLNPSCNTTLNVKEKFDKKSITAREVTKACGYVLYGIKGSRGKLGVDAFVVALDKDGIKK